MNSSRLAVRLMAALSSAAMTLGASLPPVPPGPPVPAEQYHFSVQKGHDAPNKDIVHIGADFCPKNAPKGGPVCNIDALKMRCLYMPGCVGFNTDGWLKNSTDNPVAGEPCDLYTKVPGKPSSLHFLHIPKWDAENEDLINLGTKNLTELQGACAAEPQCAAYNSNGWLKKTVKFSAKDSDDLYVKSGGAAPSGPPLPVPPPPAPPGPPAPPPVPPPPGMWKPRIWPLPRTYSNGSKTLLVSKPTGTSASLFSLASGATFDPTTERSLPSSAKYSGTIENVTVTLADYSECEKHPQLTSNESYTLSISASGTAHISAPSVWGALRAIETFSQLVVFDFDTGAHTLPLAPWKISDRPRFPHRGLMIDTSRHFETVATIKRIVTSLSFAKINTLHWHMSDDQSFPFESKTYPRLWMASYSMQERYSQADIREVVEHARLRGVRVMVEFDQPGHASSWCTGYPSVCPSPTCKGPLNPASNQTFDLIESVLGECTGKTPLGGLFPETMIHLGGDEVNTACWNEVPAIAKWLTANNLTADGGYGQFVNRSAHIAIAQGRRPVQWNEVWDHFGTALPKQSIVHAWSDRSAMARATAAGYGAINSQGWYLDGLSDFWEAMYTNDPSQGVTPAAAHLVLGGQGEMWGETVDTSDIEQTVWPRMGAIAEKLWSSADVTSCEPTSGVHVPTAGVVHGRRGARIIAGSEGTDRDAERSRLVVANADCAAINSAYPRIAAFRCLLNRRGVRAAPVMNAVAREAPPGPGGCLEQ